MTAILGTEDARATNEATDWLIRLQEEPDDPDLRARFDAWLAASSANAAAWAETAQVYHLIGEAAEAARHRSVPAGPRIRAGAAIARLDAHDRRFAPAKHRVRRAVLSLAAAALAASAVLVFLPDLVLWMEADYATSAGEQREIRLSDGSTVELGPRSAVDIAYTASARRVRLLSGQAYFEVAPDPARPFAVEARAMRITDLGTGFDVSLEQDGAAVAVRHGSVRVDDADASPPIAERLHPGEWLRVSRTGGATRGSEPADQVAAWARGLLIARDQPVSQVVDALRPYFHGFILVTNEALENRYVTGVYDLRDPADALRALAEAHGGVVHRISPWLLVLSGG